MVNINHFLLRCVFKRNILLLFYILLFSTFSFVLLVTTTPYRLNPFTLIIYRIKYNRIDILTSILGEPFYIKNSREYHYIYIHDKYIHLISHQLQVQILISKSKTNLHYFFL